MTTTQAFRLPPELEVRPRPVWRVNDGGGVKGGYWRVLAVVAVILAIIQTLRLLEIMAAVSWGQDRQARITKVDPLRRGSASPRYRVYYVAEMEGRQVPGDVSASEHDLAALGLPAGPWAPPASEGPTINVRVVRFGGLDFTNPLLPGRTLRPVIEWTAMTAGGFCLCAPALIWIAFVGPARIRRLYQEGVATPGLITRKHKVRVNGKGTRYYFDYTFRAPDGREVKDEQAVSRVMWNRAAKQEAVSVLHPEGRTHPSVVYEYGGFTCAAPPL